MNYFPLVIKITDKKASNKGEILTANTIDDIPSNTAFVVLETSVKKVDTDASSKA